MEQNLHTQVILEFQKSIENMILFGEELENLDARFGRLESRIDSLRNSLGALSSQMTRTQGGNLRRQIEQELNNLVASNGVVLRQIGNAPFVIHRETVRDVFRQIEVQLNDELRKYVRNMRIEIDPSYASGHRLPVSSEDFEAITREVARVIKLQIQALINAIQRYDHTLIPPEVLRGIEFNIGKGTVQAIINKIKQEILVRIKNPNLSGDVTLQFTRADLQKVVNQVKRALQDAFNVNIAEVKSLDARDVNAKVRRIPEEIDARLSEYVDKTVAGINAAMRGRMEVPINQLSRSVKRAVARELDVTVDQLEQQLATIDVGSLRMVEAKRQLERITRALDRKISAGLQKEVDDIVKRIEDVEISYSPRLKQHLINQINRINNKIIEKIREQIDLQVQHILQEIEEVQARPRSLNRDRQLASVSRAVSVPARVDREPVERRRFDEEARRRAEIVFGNDPYARRDAYFNTFGLQGAIINTVRHILAGTIVGTPIAMMYQALDAFRTSQTEQIKMLQNLMLKESARRDSEGNLLPPGQVNFGYVQGVLREIQDFVRRQAIFYGIDYSELYPVAGIASRLLESPAEIKKFIQYAAQLRTLDPGSDIEKIANGLEAVKAQFDLEVADMENKVIKPLAAVANVTNATVEELLEALKRSGSSFNVSNISPESAIVLAGVSIQSTGLSGSDIGNFYKSILKRLTADNTLKYLESLGVQVYDIDPLTGARIARSGDRVFEELANVLKNLDSKARRDIYDVLFGTYQSSKGAATMAEITDTYVQVKQAVDNFEQQQFMDMLRKSLQNPMVNMNRVQASFQAALDELIQELAPSINVVSYALINFAENIEENAQLLVTFGKALSDVMLGALLMRGIRWGWQKSGIPQNFELQKERTRYVQQVGGLLADERIAHLLREGVLNRTDRELRAQAAQMQRNPVFEAYFREFSNMTNEQIEHFKRYLEDKRLEIRDLPSLFMALEEAKAWEERKPLTDDEKFERSRVYANRLYTNPALSNILEPEFMRTFLNSVSNRDAFEQHRRNALGYSDIIDKMTKMSQKEFAEFERHLEELHRSGMPAIDSFERLSSAIEDFEMAQRMAIEEARKANPVYQSMQHALRGMNDEISRTTKLRNTFRDFLRDIPDLARGAGMSIVGLTKNITKLAGEMAGLLVLAESFKAIMQATALTEDQRQLIRADDMERDLTAFANDLRAQSKGLFSLENIGQSVGQALGSLMNGIAKIFGAEPSNFGWFEQMKMYEEIKKFYGFRGSNTEFAKYLKERGIDPEEAVRQWAERTGRTKEIEKIREEAFIKQYEREQLKRQEEEELRRKAEEAFNRKYRSGQLQVPLVDAEEVVSNIRERLTEIRNLNTIETLRNVLNGMKTDSEEYIKMRQAQVRKMRQVLNDELAVIDKYIANMVEIMRKNSPDSEAYKTAQTQKRRLEEQRQKIINEMEADILQEEVNLQQEIFQKRIGRVNRNIQRAELIAQARELAAAYNMDRESQAYYDTLRRITINKINTLKAELENMKKIQALGDQSEELANSILSLQNTIASEQLKLKEINLSRFEIWRQRLAERNEQREIQYLQARVRLGNPEEESPVLRNIRIAQAKQEIQEIQSIINNLKKQLPTATAEESRKIQAEIRDLMKQSLQAQLGILDELKSTQGTFNLPDGVTAVSRYEYLVSKGTHQSITIGSGDVIVHITLPNVTNGSSPAQLRSIGENIGRGIMIGRMGSLRDQMMFNPGNYRPRIP